MIIQGLLIAMGKKIRNACLGIVKNDWTSLFDNESIGNIFCLHAEIKLRQSNVL